MAVEANDTRNQHFLTRVEQKLNALNPNADARNLRIYSFEIVNRENYRLALESPKGRPIGSNLSLFDLFSFDVPGTSPLRLNFEKLFQKYETSIEVHTKNLLAKLNRNDHDIKAEIIDLFAAKLLNFVRNPFSVAKVLNSFPGLTRYDPADPALLADYGRIVSGRKPQQTRLCTELGITDTQYVEWLRLLFMLLAPMMKDRPNLFEEVIKTLVEDPKTHVAAFVSEYDTERCLLSDRGFSQPIEDGPHMAFSFNLCSTAFIDYIFADPATLVEGKGSPEFIARALADRERLGQKQIHVTFRRNDLGMLARFNRRAVEQCYRRVYCSAKEGLVLQA
ncbi:hypothetical protein ACQR2C_14270 [Bradyrhizobium sp. HKCCYLRH3061]